ncbi:MAG TPA: hypothetical protein VNM72_13320 [Blastocatellia bacterium]|nr:hypothetical protein [Blastocatellia bacterium]
MSAQAVRNLDIACAESGRELASIRDMEERVLNAALTVLEEQGPYAMFLYVQARHSEVAGEFRRFCVNLLRGVFGERVPANADALGAIRALANDPDDLLFARDLLRNALAYARYHLKAKGSSS